MPTKKPKYQLQLIYNGEEFKATGDTLEDAVEKLKPEWLHTEVYVTAQKGKEVSERRWQLKDAKRVFSDADVRHIFCNNLLLN